MRNFTHSKIYFIRSPELPTYLYVGYTTCKSLKSVLNAKRKEYRQYLEGKRNYEAVYVILQYENSIELFEQYPCQTKQQLIDRRLDVANQMANMNTAQLNDLRFRQRRNQPVNMFTMQQIERLIEIESQRLENDEVGFFESKLQFRNIESKIDNILGCEPIEC